jgi:hypothetical protein
LLKITKRETKTMTKMNTKYCALLVAMCALVGCGPASMSEESTNQTTEALTQTVVENVTPGYTLLLTYTHFTLVSSAGPNPPATPALTVTSFICNQTSTHGTYNTNTKTATMFMTSADCTTLINEVNADTATGTEYPQLTIKYDDTTCNPTTHLCTETSFTYADKPL